MTGLRKHRTTAIWKKRHKQSFREFFGLLLAIKLSVFGKIFSKIFVNIGTKVAIGQILQLIFPKLVRKDTLRAPTVWIASGLISKSKVRRHSHF